MPYFNLNSYLSSYSNLCIIYYVYLFQSINAWLTAYGSICTYLLCWFVSINKLVYYVDLLQSIQQLITNEDVKDMVRNALETDHLESQLREAIFEPRMTRSKLKEVIEKGQVGIMLCICQDLP